MAMFQAFLQGYKLGEPEGNPQESPFELDNSVIFVGGIEAQPPDRLYYIPSNYRAHLKPAEQAQAGSAAVANPAQPAPQRNLNLQPDHNARLADYKFPLLKANGRLLRGYTPVTTLRPAKEGVNALWDFTLRVGWHKASGAAVLALLETENPNSGAGKPKISLYAAACTLDEQPLEDVPESKLAAAEVVFLNNFRMMSMATLETMLFMTAQSGFTLQELIDKAQPKRETPGPAKGRWPEAELPLRTITTISLLAYEEGKEALPEEIVDAAMDRKETGLLEGVVDRIKDFHRKRAGDGEGGGEGEEGLRRSKRLRVAKG